MFDFHFCHEKGIIDFEEVNFSYMVGDIVLKTMDGNIYLIPKGFEGETWIKLPDHFFKGRFYPWEYD